MALETTLLVHGVPRHAAEPLHADLQHAVRTAGADPVLIGVLSGVPTLGMTRDELRQLLDAPRVDKVNTANLGLVMHRAAHAATTVSTTLELAAAGGVRVAATGGIGGVHHGLAAKWDVSADLAALARTPVALVCSGVKNILDVVSTREALETLGVPVIGLRTERFPAFYQRDGGCTVDETFQSEADIAAFVRAELARTSRGVVIANPIDPAEEIDAASWDTWVSAARDLAHQRAPTGRDVTPFMLAALHEVSGGATLRANIALATSNARVAGLIAAAL